MDVNVWTDNKRAAVSAFAAVQDGAKAHLVSNVAAFQAELAQLTAVETEFSQNIAALGATLKEEAIKDTLDAIASTSGQVDEAFSTLSGLIRSNNAAVAEIAAAIATASNEINQVSTSIEQLDKNVAAYRATIASFRDFTGSNIESAPAPVATEPVAEAQLVAEPAPAEPIAEAQLVAELAVAEPELVAELAVAEPELVAEPSLAEPELVAESAPAEPVAEPELVAEPAPAEPEPEPIAATKSKLKSNKSVAEL